MSLSVKWISYEDEMSYFKETVQCLPNSNRTGDKSYYYLSTAFGRHHQRERALRQKKMVWSQSLCSQTDVHRAYLTYFESFICIWPKASCQCYAYSRRQLNKHDYPLLSSIPVPLGHVYHATSSVFLIHVHMIQ